MDLVGRVRRHLARYGEWWWVPIFYTLAVIWIYRDLWTQNGHPTGFGWDTIDTHGPDLDFMSREVAELRFSMWNPYDKGGYPLFCDPVFDRYYPLNWPFAAWGAVIGTGWWLVQIKILAHHVLMGSLMHLFLRSRGLSRRAALVGGIAIVACAPVLVHKASHILWPLTYVPLVWLMIDRVLAQPTWRRGAALGATLLLPMTCGSPPGLFYAALMIAPYALVRLVMHLLVPENRTRAGLIALGAAGGVAVGIAILVAGVTVLPTSLLVELGSRDRFAPPGRTFALPLSLPLEPAARGVFVRGAGLFEMYMGAAVVMLAACAVVMRPRFDRGGPLALFGTAIVGVLLAAGATGVLLPWLVDHVQTFGMLRVPGRYKLLSAWCLAACAGYGVGALQAAQGGVRWRAVAVAAVGVLVTVAFVKGWANPVSVKDRPLWWSIVATAIAAVLIVAAAWTPRTIAEGCLAALALCALVDAPLFMFVPPHALPVAERRQTHTADDEWIPKLEGTRDTWRVYDEYVLGERVGARHRIRDFRGYPAIDPLSIKRYTEVLDFAKKEPAIITDYNVRWVLDKPHFRYGDQTSFVSLPHPAFENRGGPLYEAKHPAPLVQWVSKVMVVRASKALPAIRAIEEPDGARRYAIVEVSEAARLRELGTFSLAEPESRQGTVEVYEPDEIRFSIDAPRAGLVVLNEIMFPGWEVTVDGVEATAIRANHMLRAVEVGAGKHTIAWTFNPRMWRGLVGGYVLALLLIVAAAVLPRRA